MSRYPKAKRLSLAEQDALAVRAKAGDLAARNALIEAVIPAIATKAKRISKPGEDVEDYVQEAAIKLLESVKRYEPAKGHFLVFALPWASGARRLWMHKQGWARAYRGTDVSFRSMDAPLGEDRTLADTLIAEPDDKVERESTVRAIRARIAVMRLSKPERRLLDEALKTDLSNGFQAICADAMGLSRQRIGQLWQGRNGTGNIGVVGKLRRSLACFNG